MAEEEAQQAEQQEEATGFSAVVQRLLHRAASSLTRGTTTCLSCKGQGTCTCPACHVSSCYPAAGTCGHILLHVELTGCTEVSAQ
jgi:hypothetical protein